MDSITLQTHNLCAASPRILICPSGFKESLDPNTAADCMEEGIRRSQPDATISKIPLVDGGEGFTKALVRSTNGELRHLQVAGPVGTLVMSHFGFLGGERSKTAVIEMAAAAGLRLVPCDRRDPTRTTTYGVGQLIEAALEAGAEHILVGCGDSGTCDGGIGMAQALGAKFYNCDGSQVPLASGSAALCNLASMDLSGLHPLLKTCTIDAAVNWHNILCGPDGVARVFGPQKGASSDDIENMATAMDNCAAIVAGHLGRDISVAPGVGASGGLGAGLLLVGATLHSRYDIIMQYLNIDELLDQCDLVFTAEGAIDFQTPRGKIPAEVARRAKKRDLPVIVLAGTIGAGAAGNYEAGIDAYISMLQRPMTLADAIADAERLLTESAESVMRMVAVGWSLNESMTRARTRSRSRSTSTSTLSSVSTLTEETVPIKFVESSPTDCLPAISVLA